MAYEHFFQFYDLLMNDVPYDKYLKLVNQFSQPKSKILDLGCGSGTILVNLLKQGYFVDGLDISCEMLMITQEKLQKEDLYTNLFQDDMKNISVKNEYNMIISFLDSINYLNNEEDINKTFNNIYNALKDEGIFIFDIHSLANLDNIFDNYSYNEINEDFTYLWNTYLEKEDKFSILYHELVFFIKQNKDLYSKLVEYHKQVIFPLNFYLKSLKEVGFRINKIYYDFNEKADNNCRKIIIVVKKCIT